MKIGIVLILIGVAWCVGVYRQHYAEKQHPEPCARVQGGANYADGTTAYVQYTLLEPQTGQRFTYNVYFYKGEPVSVRLVSAPALRQFSDAYHESGR
jgi:hypothetical protein